MPPDAALPPLRAGFALSFVVFPDLTGRTLGDYRLLRRLGRGAMAEVYLAEQASLRRQVAVKVLKPQLAQDETYLRRFQQEAQAAASLIHGDIVQIHEVGCREGLHFIVQEYVPGPNLRELLARQGPPDLRRALGILRNIAAALVKASEQGIVHRDIKPENILLAPEGQAKVADFGLARSIDPAQAVELTQVGITMGTPLYMSPEQIEGRPLDARSDQYSLGVTSYELLSGRPPFRGDTSLAVAVQHLKTEPERIETHRADVPPALARIVHRLLAKRPDERFESARELLAALRAIDLGGPPEADSGAWPLAASVQGNGAAPAATRLDAALRGLAYVERRGRLGLGWLLAALVALALGVGGAMLLRGPYLLAPSNRAGGELTRQENVFSEYFQASLIDTKEGWRSFREHHGDNVFFDRTAKKQLARLHLMDREYPEAERLYRELAALPDREARFRAHGLAGLFLVATSRGDNAEATRVLSELWTLRDDLEPQMTQQIDRMLDQHREVLKSRAAEQWEDWSRRENGSS